MKEEVKKQQEQEAEEEAKPDNKRKPKQSRFMRETAERKTDPVLKKALDWLKSDVTVKQYKLDNASKPMPDTAWFSK